jgi:hypothetical protein
MMIPARLAGAQNPQLPTPPVPPTAPLPAAADLGTLTSQLAELTVQQAGLRAQLDGLRRQLGDMLQTNPARPGVQQQWADVGSQLAAVDGQIAGVRARIAQKTGRPIGLTERRVIDDGVRGGPDPDLAVAGGIAISLALVLPLSIAYAIRMLRRNPVRTPPRTEDFGPRFDRLEQAVDAIAIEVERVSEGQRFVTKILAERPAAETLALGAGPAEPIRVQERQGVRQSR